MNCNYPGFHNAIWYPFGWIPIFKTIRLPQQPIMSQIIVTLIITSKCNWYTILLEYILLWKWLDGLSLNKLMWQLFLFDLTTYASSWSPEPLSGIFDLVYFLSTFLLYFLHFLLYSDLFLSPITLKIFLSITFLPILTIF